jgi:hypothetical protein
VKHEKKRAASQVKRATSAMNSSKVIAEEARNVSVCTLSAYFDVYTYGM